MVLKKFEWSKHAQTSTMTRFLAIYIYLVHALSLLNNLTIVLEPFLEAWNLDFEHNSTYKVLNAYDEAGEEKEE